MNLTGPVRPAAYPPRPAHRQRRPGPPAAPAAMTPPGPASGPLAGISPVVGPAQ